MHDPFDTLTDPIPTLTERSECRVERNGGIGAFNEKMALAFILLGSKNEIHLPPRLKHAPSPWLCVLEVHCDTKL